MRVLCALVVLFGCNGEKDPILPATGDTGAGVTTPVPTGSDEGSVTVLSWLPTFGETSSRTIFLGIFADSRRGILNLAQCIGSAESFCFDELPTLPGDSVLLFGLDPTLHESLDTVKVGGKVTLGDWTGEYQYDGAKSIDYYYGDSSDPDMPTGPLGLHLGGDWGPYDGTDDITGPTPMRVTSPDPLGAREFYDSIPIHLQWQPGTVGQVYLATSTPAEDRLTLLEDTGDYLLDLSALNLSNGASVHLTLGRWSRATVDHDGNMVEVEIQSNQQFTGTWRTTGSRTVMEDDYDECVDAETAPSAVPGNYTGDLLGATADLNPGAGGCTGFQASGIDKVIPIDLQPEDLLTVNYQLVANDASLYLLTDCHDVQTCLVGVDKTGGGDVEQIVWFNDTGSALRVYAVLDAFNAVTDPYNLDIIIDSLGGDLLVPTCVDAMDQGPASPGSYHGSIAGYADLLEPTCAGNPMGAEGMTQILLAPGERLTATIETPAGNPGMYLLSNCAIADSCFLANDLGGGTSETLIYDNATAASQYMYLVLDSSVNLDEYFLDLAIQ